MIGRFFAPRVLSLVAVSACFWLTPGTASACDVGITECNGVCCPEGVVACFNGACDTSTGCTTTVCGGVCCPEGVVACFNGACDTSGLGSTCESLPCGTGCCTAELPVCCGDNTCAATEGSCGSGSGCAVVRPEVGPEERATWFAIPTGLLALAAIGAVRRRRSR